MTVDSEDCASLLDSICQVVENSFRILPVDAGVCDAHAVLQASLSFLRDLLVAYENVQLVHAP
jgi:hypothetical protein